MASNRILLNESIELVKDNPTTEILNKLFINIHTIKGSSRTLSFRELSEAFHLFESYISQVLKDMSNYNLENMESQIGYIDRVFQEYESINRDVLNRGKNNQRISISRDEAESIYEAVRKCVDSFSMGDSDSLSVMKKAHKILSTNLFIHLNLVVEEYCAIARELAVDLGKPEPFFDVKLADVRLTSTVKDHLDKSMVHLIRNSLDHGIESSEERRAKGKTDRGTFYFKGRCEDDILHLTVKDDGKGLNINKIRSHSLAEGKIHEKSSLLEIAESIFEAGFSTKESVSEISGRGVGMEAVSR